MKRIRFYYLLVFSVMLGFTSCEDDIINLTERDRLPTAIAVADLQGLETSMLDVYVQARSLHENNEISCYKACGTDIANSGTHMTDVQAGGMRGMMEYISAFDASSEQVRNIWNGLYLSLDKCNVVITYGGNFEAENSEEQARKDKIIGEAYCLRAYLYLELAERWDNAVISELSEEISYTAELSNQEQLLNQVVSDAQAAIPLLRSRVQTGDVGAPSKDMAYLLLAKAQMWLGDWTAAAEAADNVIAQGGQLQPLDGIFGLQGGKLGEESNQEIIFSWIFDPSIQNRPQRTVQMFVPLYDRVPGVARTLGQGARPWGRISPSPYYWTLFDSNNNGDLDDEADGRINAWHKRYWTVDDPDNIDPSLGSVQEGDLLSVTSPYFLNWASNDREARYLEPSVTKYWEDGTYGRTAADAEGFRNVIVYRLSEAYIIAAEAYMRLGNDPTALQRLNVIRERAFGDSSHNFTSIDMETIVEEQARELGFEGHRWAFLKRLGILIERVQMHNPSASANIQPKHVRWPIPNDFIQLLNLQQNEGY